jgi:hypothetical protein
MKALAIDNEDYDVAKKLKAQIEEELGSLRGIPQDYGYQHAKMEYAKPKVHKFDEGVQQITERLNKK